MIIFMLVGLGLCFGSFVNALVFRLHEQSEQQKAKSKMQKALSIWTGRSMCPNCRHQLAAKDLVPVFSWLVLKGQCRYCKQPISRQYPLVELLTAAAFVTSYIYWPSSQCSMLNAQCSMLFGLWLLILVGFVALVVYDIKWRLLPNSILGPLGLLAAASAAVNFSQSNETAGQFILAISLSLAVASGIFYLLFVLSNGTLIGGGDVKLGLVFGMLLADPLKSGLVLFLAGLSGTLILLPGLVRKKIGLKTVVPFGPLLVGSTFVVYIWGGRLLSWGLERLIFSY